MGQMLAAGALVWAFYSVIQIILNGIVLDETIVPAQIIAGAVKYPAGHPHEIFYKQAFSLPQFISAWLWGISSSPAVHSGVRNVLFLFLSIFPIFALGLILTRVPFWGHLAAVLTAAEAALQFQGIYPQKVFPNFYSNGHFGLQLAVLIPALLVSGSWRTGGFLLGLLPAIHAAMAIVVWPWTVLWLLLAPSAPRDAQRRKLLAAAAAGALITSLFVVYILVVSRGLPVAAPYDVSADWRPIHRAFTAYTDVHRQLFPLMSFGYLANPLILFLFGGFLICNKTGQDSSHPPPHDREHLIWLLILGALVWFIVYSTGIYQFLFGRLPSLVERSMPFRFSDITALMLIPFTVAAFARGFRDLPEILQGAAKAILALTLFAEGIFLFLEGGWVASFYRGRVETHLIFVFWGILVAILFFARDASRLKQVILATQSAVAFGVFAGTSPQARLSSKFAVPLLLCAAILFLISRTHFGRPILDHAVWNVIFVSGIVLLAGSAFQNKKMDRFDSKLDRWDRISADDAKLIEWLERNSRPDELILPALFPRSELQPKTGHPVLFEYESLYIMTYAPELSPVVNSLSHDLYEFDYRDPSFIQDSLVKGQGRIRPSTAWVDPWERRSQAEWQALRRKYNFRLVWCPAQNRLNLPVAFTGERWTLYVIP